MFEQSLKEIEELKARDPNCGVVYNVSINEYSDLTLQERKKYLGGGIPTPIEEDEDSEIYDFIKDSPVK